MPLHSRLTVNHEDFPVIASFKNGDEVKFSLTGTVTRIESDIIDISGYDGPAAAIGASETELVITELRVAIESAIEYR